MAFMQFLLNFHMRARLFFTAIISLATSRGIKLDQ
jgi:hypothetical protein